jgi:hypothetical protein
MKQQANEETKNETRIAQGERTINGVKYLISFTRTKSQVGPLSKPQVTVSAYSMTSKVPTPKPLTMALTELCEKFGVRPEELSKRADKLLNSLDVQSGALTLNLEYRARFLNKELKHSMTKLMNTGRKYKCMFFDVIEDDTRKILMEAHSENATFRQMKPLALSYAEVADTLEIEPSAVLSHLGDLARLLIVEDGAELQLARLKTQGNEDVPMITISVTESSNMIEPLSPEVPAKTTDELSPSQSIKLVKGISPSEAATRIQRLFRAKLSKERTQMLLKKTRAHPEEKLVLRTAYRSADETLYTLSVFANKQAYLIRAENSTVSLNCKVDRAVDASIKSVHDLVPMVKVDGNRLLYVGKTPSNPLQSQVRQSKTLLTKRDKTFDGRAYSLAVYEVETGLLIESFKRGTTKDWKMSLHVSTGELWAMFQNELPLDEVCEALRLVNGALTLAPPLMIEPRTASKQNLLEFTRNSRSREEGPRLTESGSESASKIKAHLRGFVVRKGLQAAIERLRNETEGKLVLLKVVELDDKKYAVSVRLVGKVLKVQAASFEEHLAVSVNIAAFAQFRYSPEQIATNCILPTLKVQDVHGTHKLTFDLAKMHDTRRTSDAKFIEKARRKEETSSSVLKNSSEDSLQESPICIKRPLKVFETAQVKRMPRMSSLKSLIGPDSKPDLQIDYVDSYREDGKTETCYDYESEQSIPHSAQHELRRTAGSYGRPRVNSSRQECMPAAEHRPRQFKDQRETPLESIMKKTDSARSAVDTPGFPASSDGTSSKASSSAFLINSQTPKSRYLNAGSKESPGFQDSSEVDGLTFSESRNSSGASLDDLRQARPEMTPSSALQHTPFSDHSSDSFTRSQLSEYSSDAALLNSPSLGRYLKARDQTEQEGLITTTVPPASRSSVLLVRTASKISQVSFVVSLFREKDQIRVEAVNHKRGLELCLNIGMSLPQTSSGLDKLCSQILTRLSLLRSPDGEFSLSLCRE